MRLIAQSVASAGQPAGWGGIRRGWRAKTLTRGAGSPASLLSCALGGPSAWNPPSPQSPRILGSASPPRTAFCSISGCPLGFWGPGSSVPLCPPARLSLRVVSACLSPSTSSVPLSPHECLPISISALCSVPAPPYLSVSLSSHCLLPRAPSSLHLPSLDPSVIPSPPHPPVTLSFCPHGPVCLSNWLSPSLYISTASLRLTPVCPHSARPLTCASPMPSLLSQPELSPLPARPLPLCPPTSLSPVHLCPSLCSPVSLSRSPVGRSLCLPLTLSAPCPRLPNLHVH